MHYMNVISIILIIVAARVWVGGAGTTSGEAKQVAGAAAAVGRN